MTKIFIPETQLLDCVLAFHIVAMFESFQTESEFQIRRESVIMVHLSTKFHVPISAI